MIVKFMHIYKYPKWPYHYLPLFESTTVTVNDSWNVKPRTTEMDVKPPFPARTEYWINPGHLGVAMSTYERQP